MSPQLFTPTANVHRIPSERRLTPPNVLYTRTDNLANGPTLTEIWTLYSSKAPRARDEVKEREESSFFFFFVIFLFDSPLFGKLVIEKAATEYNYTVVLLRRIRKLTPVVNSTLSLWRGRTETEKYLTVGARSSSSSSSI